MLEETETLIERFERRAGDPTFIPAPKTSDAVTIIGAKPIPLAPTDDTSAS
jgi:hypothetical protein